MIQIVVKGEFLFIGGIVAYKGWFYRYLLFLSPNWLWKYWHNYINLNYGFGYSLVDLLSVIGLWYTLRLIFANQEWVIYHSYSDERYNVSISTFFAFFDNVYKFYQRNSRLKLYTTLLVFESSFGIDIYVVMDNMKMPVRVFHYSGILLVCNIIYWLYHVTGINIKESISTQTKYCICLRDWLIDQTFTPKLWYIYTVADM